MPKNTVLAALSKPGKATSEIFSIYIKTCYGLKLLSIILSTDVFDIPRK